MGLQQFENRLERLVEGVFARVSRGGLQPVELARRLTREMDLERTMGLRGPIAPNFFTVVLSPKDSERFAPFAPALASELAEGARDHARDEGYHFMGPVEVALEADRALSAGVFRIKAEIRGGEAPAAHLVLPDGRRVAVGDEPVEIGRLPECAVVLSDPNVSRRHAQVVRRDNAVFIVDLDSTNGTQLNGSAIKESPLADGDRIAVGETVLRVELG